MTTHAVRVSRPSQRVGNEPRTLLGVDRPNKDPLAAPHCRSPPCLEPFVWHILARGLDLSVVGVAFGVLKHSGPKMIHRVSGEIKAEPVAAFSPPSLHEVFAKAQGFSHLAPTPAAQDGCHIRTEGPQIKRCGNYTSSNLLPFVAGCL